MKKFTVALSVFSVLLSLNLQAIDSSFDVIMIDSYRYEVKNPIRYKDAKSAKEFSKDPFYIDFMKRVLDDDAILNGKSANPPFEIDRCISENLSKKRSLQLSAVECFSREVDRNYTGYGTWAEKNGNEVLVLPKSPARFLDSYLQGINLPKEIKKDKNIRESTCFENPNNSKMNCEKFRCDPSEIERDSRNPGGFGWCGKFFCERGKAFLKKDADDLESYYNSVDKKPNIDTSAFGMDIKKLIELDNSMDTIDSYDPKKFCFSCPPGSKMDDYGSACIDKNGCNAIQEEYSHVKKRCINKYKNYERNCSDFYNEATQYIEYMRDLEIAKPEFYLTYFGIGTGIQIKSKSLTPEKRSQFTTEFTVRASQAIARYEQRAKSCNDGKELIDDFGNDFIDMSSKYNCEKNSDGQCKNASCIKCKGLYFIFSENFKNISMPSLRIACGSHILRRLLHSLPDGKYRRLRDELFNCGPEPIQCPEFSITEQEVIRAGFDCARETAFQRKSTGSK